MVYSAYQYMSLFLPALSICRRTQFLEMGSLSDPSMKSSGTPIVSQMREIRFP